MLGILEQLRYALPQGMHLDPQWIDALILPGSGTISVQGSQWYVQLNGTLYTFDSVGQTVSDFAALLPGATVLQDGMAELLALPNEVPQLSLPVTLQLPTNPLWFWLGALARLFEGQYRQLSQTVAQMDPSIATGPLLDWWGATCNVQRYPNEPDTNYAQRIVAYRFRPNVSNGALANFFSQLGYGASVTDTAPGQFTITISYPLSITTFRYTESQLVDILNALKAVGTTALVNFANTLTDSLLALDAALFQNVSQAQVWGGIDPFNYLTTVQSDAPLVALPLTDLGTIALDISPYGHNGTIENGATSTAGLVFGLPTAIQFATRPNTTSSTTAPPQVLLAGDSLWNSLPQNSFSIECWLQTPSTDTNVDEQNAALISCATFAAGWIGTTGFYLSITNSAGIYQQCGPITLPNDGAIHHFVATFAVTNGTIDTCTVYLDGVLADTLSVTTTQTESPPPAAPSVQIGAGANAFYGTLAGVAIYADLLSPTQITAHYQAGHGQFTRVINSETTAILVSDAWQDATNTLAATLTIGTAAPVSLSPTNLGTILTLFPPITQSLWATPLAGGTPVLKKYVAWDPLYPSGALFNGGALASALVSSYGFTQLDANQTAATMQTLIQGNAATQSVFVLANGMTYDTISANMNQSDIIYKYLEAGGRIIWAGDIPFYYQGHQGGTITTIGPSGQQTVLGLPYSGLSTNAPITFTTAGIDWLDAAPNWTSYWPQAIIDPLIPLTYNSPPTLASAWLLPIQQGLFIRVLDTPFNAGDSSWFSIWNYLSTFRLLPYCAPRPAAPGRWATWHTVVVPAGVTTLSLTLMGCHTASLWWNGTFVGSGSYQNPLITSLAVSEGPATAVITVDSYTPRAAVTALFQAGTQLIDYTNANWPTSPILSPLANGTPAPTWSNSTVNFSRTFYLLPNPRSAATLSVTFTPTGAPQWTQGAWLLLPNWQWNNGGQYDVPLATVDTSTALWPML